jgi:hypothetical protein
MSNAGVLDQMAEMTEILADGPWHQPRPDRWRHNTELVEVETGYVMGEARLTVRRYVEGVREPVLAHTFVSRGGSVDLPSILRNI